MDRLIARQILERLTIGLRWINVTVDQDLSLSIFCSRADHKSGDRLPTATPIIPELIPVTPASFLNMSYEPITNGQDVTQLPA